MSVSTYSLPALPYDYNVGQSLPIKYAPSSADEATLTQVSQPPKALEPSISAQIMELHHGKHHQAYVTNLNNAVKSYAEATSSSDIAAQIALQAAVRFNGGGHINHSLFWQNLCPASSPDADAEAAAPKLAAEIARVWGSLDAFKGAMGKALLGIQGSGWGWLVKDVQGDRLRIVTTKDQDPIVGGEVPIFGIDMWEHAYYLQVRSTEKRKAFFSFSATLLMEGGDMSRSVYGNMLTCFAAVS